MSCSSTVNLLLLLLSTSFVITTCAAATPVKVLVCTESLCPDCEQFVQKQLVPIYSQLGPDVIDLQVVPYGNARRRINSTTIECQHGVGECDANVYELCAIYMNPNPNDYLPFLDCLAKVLPMGRHDEPLNPQLFQNCASGLLWWSGIQACHGNPATVQKVLQAAAVATPSDHQYVPWITIEGIHLDEEQLDFKTEICKAFVVANNGESHPACSSTTVLLLLEE